MKKININTKKYIFFILSLTVMVSSCKKDNAVVPELSNIQKATEVVKSLESGDITPGNLYINATNYVNHNMSAANGLANFLAYIGQSHATGSTVNIMRSFEDGNYVFLHSQYHLFDKDYVVFDVFRFENGMIVEHWDNLQDLAWPTASGHTMIDGSTTLTDIDKTSTNKTTISNYVNDVFIGGHFSNFGNYVSSVSYIQHNPYFGDGLESLIAASQSPFFQSINYESVFKILGQGNFVLVMARIKYQGKNSGLFDLMRLENGKTVEHWDILQPIPTSQAEGLNPDNTAGKW